MCDSFRHAKPIFPGKARRAGFYFSWRGTAPFPCVGAALRVAGLFGEKKHEKTQRNGAPEAQKHEKTRGNGALEAQKHEKTHGNGALEAQKH